MSWASRSHSASRRVARTARPASSIVSLTATCAAVSPGSAQPPGIAQPPSVRSRTSSTRPSRTITARTSTFGVGWPEPGGKSVSVASPGPAWPASSSSATAATRS